MSPPGTCGRRQRGEPGPGAGVCRCHRRRVWVLTPGRAGTATSALPTPVGAGISPVGSSPHAPGETPAVPPGPRLPSRRWRILRPGRVPGPRPPHLARSPPAPVTCRGPVCGSALGHVLPGGGSGAAAGRSPSPGQEATASARTAPSAGRAPGDAEGGSGTRGAQGVPTPGMGPVCPQSKGEPERAAVLRPPVTILAQPFPMVGAAAAGAQPRGLPSALTVVNSHFPQLLFSPRGCSASLPAVLPVAASAPVPSLRLARAQSIPVCPVHPSLRR